MAKIVLFVVNAPEFFLSHRLPIALAAMGSGYDVHVASSNGECVNRIIASGFHHHVIPIARSGQNPFRELWSLLKLYGLFRDLKPHLVHLITIKPVLYGGIAAKLAGVKAVVAAVSGLGTVFVEDTGLAKARRILVGSLYRMAFNREQLAVIFQNPDDRDALLGLNALKLSQVRMIRGSGVSLDEYPFVPEPDGTPIVVMAARLLKGKGVLEFVDAARLLNARDVKVIMRLIGTTDPGNPTSITDREVSEWTREGVVELMGYRADISAQYANANIVCLPSHYGEGLPKTLVEGAACGRAVVTTDHPGCRDAIEEDITGVLVPVKDPIALADAIEELVRSPQRRAEMGRAGRKLAEKEFAIEIVVGQHLKIYEELLADG